MDKEVASKGGEARAKSLTAVRRKEIARNAVMSRWVKKYDKVYRAVAEGKPLIIGDLEISCAVLEDGTRVLSRRGVENALGMKNKGKKVGAGKLPTFLDFNALKPFITADLAVPASNPIIYLLERGGYAFGIKAEILPKICAVWMDANKTGKLNETQKRIAERAETLIKGFAEVGIIALVDEATGYQDLRARNELQKILAAYIAPELLPWTSRFPVEFYKQLFKVYGWDFTPLSVKKPKAVGKLTETLIYKKLPDGVLEELRNKNPRNDSGNRNHKHHQFLSEEIGNPHLEKQILKVTTLLQVSDNKEDFKRHFAKAFPEADSHSIVVPQA